MAEVIFDLLMDDLRKIAADSTMYPIKDEIESLYHDLEFIRTFIKDSEESSNEHEELKCFLADIREVVSKALFDFDSFVYGLLMGKLLDYNNLDLKVRNFGEEMKIFKKKGIEIMVGSEEIKIFKKKGIEIMVASEEIMGESQDIENASRKCYPQLGDQEIMVGFEDEVKKIKERLTNDVQTELEVISIVGMGGLGKTTLALKVYNDPLIAYYFYVRGWTNVSQVYRKRDLLVDILTSVNDNKVNIDTMVGDTKLGEELYKSLKGRRYLIVIDDLWEIRAWEELKVYFPNDTNGSRVIITTRLRDVALRISPNDPLHSPHFLSAAESWELLRRKAFPDEDCPLKLINVGRQIAVECHGLPLAIVLVGGLLAKNKDLLWWEEVAERVSSNIVGDDSKQFSDILELSYKHLPHHLKACFMSFGAFAEDYEIPTLRLIRLWMAKGFVQHQDEKSLEDVAENYLRELIDRNLVLVSRKRSRGGPKVCQIHDILRDLSLRKAKESSIIPHIDWYVLVTSPSTLVFDHKLLMVLDLSGIVFQTFPNDALLLFHLRYLKLYVYSLDRLPPKISNLWNIQTLIVDRKVLQNRVHIPLSICKLEKLRHLHISGEIEYEKPLPEYVHNNTVLRNLQTMSSLPLFHPSVGVELFLALTPNLKKLQLYGLSNSHDTFAVPDLAHLCHLDTLKLTDKSDPIWQIMPLPDTLPYNLKKVSLSGSGLTGVEWDEISKLGKLPNLEVLKLRHNFVSGQIWESVEGEFLKLRYLKLSWMDLQHWITSVSHFPRLQHLVFDWCLRLKEIPSCLGDIPTMEMIEVSWSSFRAIRSAMLIQEEQAEMGNDGLVVLVYGRPISRSKTYYDLSILNTTSVPK